MQLVNRASRRSRNYINNSIGFTLIPTAFSAQSHRLLSEDNENEIVIEHAVSGRPHEGKVLAAIQPHSDDIPIFAGGTVAKLMEHKVIEHLQKTK